MEGQFSTENEAKILEIENHLSNNAYLSGGPLPGPQDAQVFFALKAAPDSVKYFNFFHWFATLSLFNPLVIHTWAAPKKEHGHKHEGAKDVPAAETKKDEDDLFGGDDDEEKLKALKIKKEEEIKAKAAKKVKEAVIPRSIVIFDVKIIEEEQNLDDLAKKILEIKMDGLLWKTEYKLIPVAYKIKKLQMGCIIEDDKVSTDDLFDKVLAWEDEVQSVDVESFQKV